MSCTQFSWAPGKGMKDKKYKDYWDMETGCSYIPHSVLTEDVDLDELEVGGVIDEETIPQNLKSIHAYRHTTLTQFRLLARLICEIRCVRDFSSF